MAFFTLQPGGWSSSAGATEAICAQPTLIARHGPLSNKLRPVLENIENNPMQSSKRPSALEQQLDTSGKSGAFIHHPAIL